MKRLVLVRHAKSSWDNAALNDFDRPLNPRGLHDADAMAARLLRKIEHLDAFISSPAQRARATAEKFALAFGTSKDQIIFEPRLYLSSKLFFEQLVSEANDLFNSIAVFSHNPGITDFANTLTSSIQTDNIPTCGIFAVSAATNSWKDFKGTKKELLFYDYPKLQQ